MNINVIMPGILSNGLIYSTCKNGLRTKTAKYQNLMNNGKKNMHANLRGYLSTARDGAIIKTMNNAANLSTLATTQLTIITSVANKRGQIMNNLNIDNYEIFNKELLDAYDHDDTYYFADDGEYSSFYLEIERHNKYRKDDKIYIFDENNDTEITDGGLSCFISQNNRDIYNEIVNIMNSYTKLKNI